MEPALKSGRFVLGIRSQRIRKGDYIVAKHNGKEVIKLLREIKGDKAFLSGNRTAHDVGWVNLDDIKGRIVWPRR